MDTEAEKVWSEWQTSGCESRFLLSQAFDFLEGVSMGDKIADKHGVQRGKWQLVCGMVCFEMVPASKVGWESS